MNLVAHIRGHGRYDIMRADGSSVSAIAKKKADIIVGDRVTLEEQEGNFLITEIEARRTEIKKLTGDTRKRLRKVIREKPVAANVDIGIIVASAKKPSFQPRFVDRYLAILQNAGVEPALCINKIDLGSLDHAQSSIYKDIGIEIVETSAVTGEGIEKMKWMIQNRIAVLVGNSGTGKSSLINTIIPNTDIRTREVNVKTGTGKHTTSATGLYRWAPDSFLIDTPGVRSLGVGNIPKTHLQFLFPEFEDFAAVCKFRNCQHVEEPHCAVKEAVERGELDEGRYDSYLRMLRE